VTAEAAAAPLLELAGVEAGYGPYRALFGVSFAVPEGAAVALIGPNGAGKSTVARVVTGLVRPSAGTVRFAGTDITRSPPWRTSRLGLSYAPEGRGVFASLTVEENLVLNFGAAVGREGEEQALERAYEGFPRLKERRNQAAGTLSGGEQKLLALARVLVVPRRLLIVDEPSLGLAPRTTDEVFSALGSILAAGTALLLVEQQVTRALEIAERVVVLAKGEVVREGGRAEVGDDVGLLLGLSPDEE
jgi:branched-chain amino acid transport system ATP-binding protein